MVLEGSRINKKVVNVEQTKPLLDVSKNVVDQTAEFPRSLGKSKAHSILLKQPNREPGYKRDDKSSFMPISESYRNMIVPRKQIKSGELLVPMQRIETILDVARGVRVLDRYLI